MTDHKQTVGCHPSNTRLRVRGYGYYCAGPAKKINILQGFSAARREAGTQLLTSRQGRRQEFACKGHGDIIRRTSIWTKSPAVARI